VVLVGGQPVGPSDPAIRDAQCPRPQGRPSVGLFLDLEVRLLDGPLFVGERYDVVHTIVGISESRRTESFWTKTAITPAGDGRTIATVVLHQGVFKESFPDYPLEKAANAPV
jgi:hypothetical protein